MAVFGVEEDDRDEVKMFQMTLPRRSCTVKSQNTTHGTTSGKGENRDKMWKTGQASRRVQPLQESTQSVQSIKSASFSGCCSIKLKDRLHLRIYEHLRDAYATPTGKPASSMDSLKMMSIGT
ncbi:hypothetical protein ACOMHN_011959 [Nucella lapillus]